eukprot:CAMPEP_0197515644 /NCGR_PEP_ID=MMETSP1318-20131121/708_1 /TAXON_ID=552666 /ORGANISM="Partenskyella glossopodia, Strain RCC365" /LENGTH=933 /DNA_ID=CAMNT_0043064069 /DNA_START=341 /DNA_END=3139 /DNA_ORIENTATION=-
MSQDFLGKWLEAELEDKPQPAAAGKTSTAAGQPESKSPSKNGESADSSPAHRKGSASQETGDMLNWLNTALEEPIKTEIKDDDDSGDDDFDSMKWLMTNINEESTSDDIPVGAPHISDEEWKKVEVDVILSEKSQASKTGWLQKRGKTNNAYRRRFCEIRGNRFYYYHSEVDGQGEEKRGEIKLLNAHVAAEIEAKGDRMVRKGDFLHYVDAEAARAQAVWIENEEIRRCMNHTCQRKFNMAWRRHHCRYCGRIFCADCITTGRGRKLKNQPAKVDKQGYEGVKICLQCAVLPATRMTRPVSYITSEMESESRPSNSVKRNTLPNTLPSKVSLSALSKRYGSASDALTSSATDNKFHSAPIERSFSEATKPPQLPDSFMANLDRNSLEDMLDGEEPTAEGDGSTFDMPAQLPAEWMQGLAHKPPSQSTPREEAEPADEAAAAAADREIAQQDTEKTAAGASAAASTANADSAANATGDGDSQQPQQMEQPTQEQGDNPGAGKSENKEEDDSKKLQPTENSGLPDSVTSPTSNYAEKKANSIKRRKNRAQMRQTYTKIPAKSLKEIADSKKEETTPKYVPHPPAGPPPEFATQQRELHSRRSSGGSDAIVVDPEVVRGPEYDTVVFSIQPQGMSRRYFFQAESTDVCQEWVRVLKIHTLAMNRSILKRKNSDQDDATQGSEKNDKTNTSAKEQQNNSLAKMDGLRAKSKGDLPVSPKQRKVRFSSKNEYYKSGNKIDPEKKNWVRTGYLAKVGMQIRTWKVRFFALRGDMLTYFKISGKLRQQRGTVWLKGAEVVKAGSIPVSKKHRFEPEILEDDVTPNSAESRASMQSKKKGSISYHSRNPTKHVVAMSSLSTLTNPPPKRSSSLHIRNVSSDSLEPNVRKEKTRYVHEFVIKTRQQPKFKSKHGDDVHYSCLKPGRTYTMRAASRRDRREW